MYKRQVFDAAVPHMRRQKEKFVAADRIFFPVDSKGTLSAAHQNQNPLGHHAVRMDIPSAEFVHFRADGAQIAPPAKLEMCIRDRW